MHSAFNNNELEESMIEVTKAASEQIAEYFKDKDPVPVRIFVNSGGWGGPSIAMALDEAKDTDEVYEVDGFKYVADKDFLKEATPIKVDFLETGFKVTSSIVFDSACGSCSTEGSCCS